MIKNSYLFVKIFIRQEILLDLNCGVTHERFKRFKGLKDVPKTNLKLLHDLWLNPPKIRIEVVG